MNLFDHLVDIGLCTTRTCSGGNDFAKHSNATYSYNITCMEYNYCTLYQRRFKVTIPYTH